MDDPAAEHSPSREAILMAWRDLGDADRVMAGIREVLLAPPGWTWTRTTPQERADRLRLLEATAAMRRTILDVLHRREVRPGRPTDQQPRR